MQRAALLLILAGSVQAAAPSRVALRYRPGTRATYLLRVDTTEGLAAGDGKDESHVRRVLRETRQTLLPGEGGGVVLEIEAGRTRREVDGHRSAPVAAAGFEPVRKVEISSTGAALAPVGSPGHPGSSFLVLPIRPVRVGDTWKTTRPAEGGRPWSMEITHTLAALDEVDGTLVARLRSRCEEARPFENHSTRITLAAEASFDVDAGHLLDATSSLAMSVEYAADPATKRPPIAFRRNVHTRIRRTAVEALPGPAAAD